MGLRSLMAPLGQQAKILASFKTGGRRWRRKEPVLYRRRRFPKRGNGEERRLVRRGRGGAGDGVTPPQHHRRMAMLLLRLQLASNVCGGRASSWSSSFLPSSSSFLLSSSSIGTRGQAIRPWAATLRIRSSSWRRRPSHLSEDGNSSWTSPPPPPPPPPAPSPPPPPPLSRPSSSPPLCTQEQQQQRSWNSKYYYYLLLSDGVRKSRALRASGEVAKMDSMKDVTIPINMPPTATSLLVREEQKSKTSRMTRQGSVVALSYMVCAVLLVMFNKAALSTYNFPCANVITVLQMVCSTALLYVLRKLDIITFANDGNGTMDPVVKGFVPLRILKRASPLSIAYLFYMVLGMASIRGVNVPMYTTLRRTTVLFTMVLEFFLVGQKHSTPVVSSVGFIVLGALIAGARDLSFDAYGYLVVLASNLTTAMYLTTISRLGKSTGLNSFGLMWCNGIICGPILLLWTILNGELGMALQFPAMLLPGFQLVLVLSCMMAFCLNYTIFLNTSLNSPLTQTMCGNIKDLGTVLIGWLLFGGLPFDWLNVLGQLLGFLGSGLYAYCKLRGI